MEYELWTEEHIEYLESVDKARQEEMGREDEEPLDKEEEV